VAEDEGVVLDADSELDELGLVALAMELWSLLVLESEEFVLVLGDEVDAVLLEEGEELRDEDESFALVLVLVRSELEEAVEPYVAPVEAGDVVLEAAGSVVLALLLESEPLPDMAPEALPETEELEDEGLVELIEVEADGDEDVEESVVEVVLLNGLTALAWPGVEVEAEPYSILLLLVVEVDVLLLSTEVELEELAAGLVVLEVPTCAVP
jgi:hypothetical protein